MIPFQGRLPCLQYVKNKPNPAGVMLFVPCGRLEMVYRFDFYQSKNTGIPAEYKTLVLVESVVMRLVENLPQIEKFILTFFFTGILLVAELKNKAFCALGVLKINSWPTYIECSNSMDWVWWMGTKERHEKKSHFRPNIISRRVWPNVM